MREFNDSNIAVISVDGIVFKTIFRRDGIGYDLKHFGVDNEWGDGKHYAGIMKCLLICHEDGAMTADIERKGSKYSVTLTA